MDTAQLVKNPGTGQSFTFGEWRIESCRRHILPSHCSHKCNQLQKDDTSKMCNYCRFENELSSLPRFPDMTFDGNSLRLEHADGFGVYFDCLEALRAVNIRRQTFPVANANVWQEARSDLKESKEVVKPFDWTFTTDFKGTLFGGLQAVSTREHINVEKLKVKEEILFYEDLCLFEDELADNGVAQCSVKMRVMKSCLFLLLRYFLRIDNVLLRINDTRIYHETGTNYMLREYCSRESKASDINVPISVLTNPQELAPHLPIQETILEKLEFPVRND